MEKRSSGMASGLCRRDLAADFVDRSSSSTGRFRPQRVFSVFLFLLLLDARVEAVNFRDSLGQHREKVDSDKGESVSFAFNGESVGKLGDFYTDVTGLAVIVARPGVCTLTVGRNITRARTAELVHAWLGTAGYGVKRIGDWAEIWGSEQDVEDREYVYQNRVVVGAGASGAHVGSALPSVGVGASSAGVAPGGSPSVGTGTTEAVVDVALNTVHFSGPHLAVEDIRRRHEVRDRSIPNVRVHVVVLDSTVGEDTEIGVDVLQRELQPSWGQALSLPGTSGGSVPKVKLSELLLSRGTVFAFSSKNFDAFVHLLETSTKVNVDQRPDMLVRSGQAFTFFVGQDVPSVTSFTSGVGANSGVVTRDVSVTRLRAGFTMVMTPVVLGSGRISVDGTVGSDEIVGNTDVGGVVQPLLASRSVSTGFTVSPGRVVSVGGLVRQRRTHAVNGVPFISKVPFVGALFRSTSDTVDRVQTSVLISLEVEND